MGVFIREIKRKEKTEFSSSKIQQNNRNGGRALRWIGKGLAAIYVKECSTFSSKSFTVASLTFMYLIHFEFIFVLGSILTLFFYMCLSSFPRITS